MKFSHIGFADWIFPNHFEIHEKLRDSENKRFFDLNKI